MELTRLVVPRLLDPTYSVAELAKALEENPHTNLARSTADKRASALASWREQVELTVVPETSGGTVLVLHLSDIHLANDASDTAPHRVEAIVNVLAARFDIIRPALCVVALTGDIAFSGREGQYKVAHAFVKKLTQGLSSRLRTSVCVVCTPGNHDCDFEREDSVRVIVLDALSSDRIDQAVIKESAKVQAAFADFCGFYDSHLSQVHADLGASVAIVKFGKWSLRFDRYNTAWCSRLHEQQGSLLFRVPEFPKSLPDSDAVLALFHHPYNWLEAGDAKRFRDHIDATADIVLTGHEHTGGRHRRILETGQQTEFVEGRVLQDAEEPTSSGFNAIVLDLEELTQESMTFRWEQADEHYALDDRYPPRPSVSVKVVAA